MKTVQDTRQTDSNEKGGWQGGVSRVRGQERDRVEPGEEIRELEAGENCVRRKNHKRKSVGRTIPGRWDAGWMNQGGGWVGDYYTYGFRIWWI